jgi:hypothetical protein
MQRDYRQTPIKQATSWQASGYLFAIHIQECNINENEDERRARIRANAQPFRRDAWTITPVDFRRTKG